MSRRLTPRLLGAAAGVLADRRFGEPAVEPHPVAAFGTVMAAVERGLWRDSRPAGVVHAGVGVGLGAAAGSAMGSGALPTAAATYVAVAGRSLGDVAAEIGSALEAGDLEGARDLLPSLVGRDPTGLDEREIARAVVESVGENTVDAVIAPAFWGALLGPSGALGYRAANTLDAMVGHRNERYERYGWASARLDDLANLAPARLTALLVAACRPATAPAIWRAVRDDAPAHPSPNAGVAEAAFAAALGVQLGGTNRYGDQFDHRAALGEGRPPAAADIGSAVRLADDVTALLVAVLVVAAVGSTIRRRRWLRGRR